jgi:photosystem II stability/assembly factor-like uncharacterized protein
MTDKGSEVPAMNRRQRVALAVAALVGSVALAATVAAPAFKDVLDTPSLQSARTPRTLFNGLARAGDRVVAVGQRGHVVYSDDAGKTWKQASVPLAADLVAVSFPSPTQGWAVGHGAVILHTTDAGATWTRQFDGRQLGDAMAAYTAAPAPAASDAHAAAVLDDAKRFAAQGPEASLLDVWFADESHGLAVGAFGLILQTSDGGAHWAPMLHAVDNPKGLHFYAVRGIGDDVWIAGEQGLLLKLDRTAGAFRPVAQPYAGTLFGIVGNARAVIIHGLRGTVLRSTDGGATWHAIDTHIQAGLTAGTIDAQGRIVLASQSGNVLVSDDDGETFLSAPQRQPLPAAGVIAAAKGALVIAGPRGVSPLALP